MGHNSTLMHTLKNAEDSLLTEMLIGQRAFTTDDHSLSGYTVATREGDMYEVWAGSYLVYYRDPVGNWHRQSDLPACALKLSTIVHNALHGIGSER